MKKQNAPLQIFILIVLVLILGNVGSRFYEQGRAGPVSGIITFNPGEYILAPDVNTNFQKITNELNGQVDSYNIENNSIVNADIYALAAIDDTKLSCSGDWNTLSHCEGSGPVDNADAMHTHSAESLEASNTTGIFSTTSLQGILEDHEVRLDSLESGAAQKMAAGITYSGRQIEFSTSGTYYGSISPSEYEGNSTPLYDDGTFGSVGLMCGAATCTEQLWATASFSNPPVVIVMPHHEYNIIAGSHRSQVTIEYGATGTTSTTTQFIGEYKWADGFPTYRWEPIWVKWIAIGN
ncbi:MAG: hypothetical protein U9Q07_05460 [Planctomycetota bacterium]|nr:hypothetical protein [Planctomycetota bacterium]